MTHRHRPSVGSLQASDTRHRGTSAVMLLVVLAFGMPRAAGAFGRVNEIRTPQATLRTGPHSFFIGGMGWGKGKEDDRFYVTRSITEATSGAYVYGYAVSDGFRGCAWIQKKQLKAKRGADHHPLALPGKYKNKCTAGSKSISYDDIASPKLRTKAEGFPPVLCDPKKCAETCRKLGPADKVPQGCGKNTITVQFRLPAATPFYLNYTGLKPNLDSGQRVDQITTLDAKTQVGVRYVTRDRAMANVRVQTPQKQGPLIQAWGFIPVSSLPAGWKLPDFAVPGGGRSVVADALVEPVAAESSGDLSCGVDGTCASSDLCTDGRCDACGDDACGEEPDCVDDGSSGEPLCNLECEETDCGTSDPGSTCSVACFDGHEVSMSTGSEAECQDAWTQCQQHCRTASITYAGREIYHGERQYCCALCGNREAYHQVGSDVCSDCTGAAAAYCSEADRGVLQDADWQPLQSGTQCVPPAHLCAISCHDGQHFGRLSSSADECLSTTQTLCSVHDGTEVSTYDGRELYRRPVHPCSVRCCDGQVAGPVESGSNLECQGVAQQLCIDRGSTASSIRRDNDEIATMGCPKSCTTSCCAGQILRGPDMVTEQQCAEWSWSACAAQGTQSDHVRFDGTVTRDHTCPQTCTASCCSGAILRGPDFTTEQQCAEWSWGACEGQGSTNDHVRFGGTLTRDHTCTCCALCGPKRGVSGSQPFTVFRAIDTGDPNCVAVANGFCNGQSRPLTGAKWGYHDSGNAAFCR